MVKHKKQINDIATRSAIEIFIFRTHLCLLQPVGTVIRVNTANVLST